MDLWSKDQQVFVAKRTPEGRMFPIPAMVVNVTAHSIMVNYSTKPYVSQDVEFEIGDRRVSLTYEECNFICRKLNMRWVEKRRAEIKTQELKCGN